MSFVHLSPYGNGSNLLKPITLNVSEPKSIVIGRNSLTGLEGSETIQNMVIMVSRYDYYCYNCYYYY